MIHAGGGTRAKKPGSRWTISAGVLLGEKISTARLGAPGKNRWVWRVKPADTNRALVMNEMSGARQLRLCIQKPVLESSTAPRRWVSLKLTSAVNRREQMSPC